MFITTNQCDKIAKCVDVCPTKAIRFIDDKPFSCITCGICFDNCPNNAIFKNKYGGYVVDRAKCNGCGVCQFNCPVNSIHIENGIVHGICVRCGLCEDSCPKHARIDGNKLTETKKISFLENLSSTLNRFNNNMDNNSTNTINNANNSTNTINKINNSINSNINNNLTNNNIVKRNSMVTCFDKCILCGRCEYYCPTNAIMVDVNEKGVCTQCRVCEDNCPTKAINNQVIDHDKCVLCLNCLKNCPNKAIVENDFKVMIKKSDNFDIDAAIGDINNIPTGIYLSCLNCGLCSDLDKGESLKRINNKMRFDPARYNEGDLDEAIFNCPVFTLRDNKELISIIENLEDSENSENIDDICDIKNIEINEDIGDIGDIDSENIGNKEYKTDSSLVPVDGYCVSCGKCAIVCDLAKARSFKEIIWDGSISDGCISCGTCSDVCPKDAITLTNGSILVDKNKCILCETCAIHCFADVIPKTTSLKMTVFEGFNYINQNLCINCKLCYHKCPEEAIIDNGDSVNVNEDKCIYCGACKTACPSNAFTFERKFAQDQNY
ncbi:MAG: 4Fe-4S binding protein [Methanobrevibacter sp.]|jgi:energy-converting hydrogenase B subunit K|nr:4Fe-4S binding protein [Candidatus Methanoflexus mossambicus]